MTNLKIFLFLVGFAVASCQSNTYEEVSKVSDKIVAVINPSYENNVKPIININCVGCHSPGVNQLPYLRNYSEVKVACMDGDVLCRIQGLCGDIMPQSGKMTQANIDVIKLWTSQGFVN